MLVSHTGEEQLFELLAEVLFVDAYSHDAVLDDVGHNHFTFFSTFYSYSRRKVEMFLD